MKRIIFISALVFAALVSQSQSYNPYVNQGIVSPAPMLPYEFNGVGILSFNVGNTGSTPLPLVEGDEMILVVELENGLPDNANPLDALGGSWLTYFDWVYDSGLNTFYGTQNQEIPDEDQGSITIAYKVTVNTPSTGALNGFEVTLLPPSYTDGLNSTDDDLVSSYTYVHARDYGDAPLSYGEVYHEINVFKDPTNTYYLNYMYLGDGVGPESGYPVCPEADCDDLDDGVVFPVMIAGTTVAIPVKLTIEDAEVMPDELFGMLNAWIDWNGDGVFNNADGEKIITGFLVDYISLGDSNSATLFFNVNIPVTAVTGMPIFARFRFGNSVTNANQQFANTWGEVEDYMVYLTKIITWTGTVSSDWFNPLNWDPEIVPGSNDYVLINSAPYYPIVYIDMIAYAKKVTLNAGSHLEVIGTLNVVE